MQTRRKYQRRRQERVAFWKSGICQRGWKYWWSTDNNLNGVSQRSGRGPHEEGFPASIGHHFVHITILSTLFRICEVSEGPQMSVSITWDVTLWNVVATRPIQKMDQVWTMLWDGILMTWKLMAGEKQLFCYIFYVSGIH